jgi:hypothetical protein
MAGWSGVLPAKLWGPRFYLSNMKGDILEKRGFFQLLDPQVTKRSFEAIYRFKNDHFTKTGSGQTQGKLKKRTVFPQNGSMYSAQSFIGLIDNPMSLRDFPFDMNTVRIDLVSSQNVATVDSTSSSSFSAGQNQYNVRLVGGPTGTGLQLLGWSGEIAEWRLHGVATKLVTRDVDGEA